MKEKEMGRYEVEDRGMQCHRTPPAVRCWPPFAMLPPAPFPPIASLRSLFPPLLKVCGHGGSAKGAGKGRRWVIRVNSPSLHRGLCCLVLNPAQACRHHRDIQEGKRPVRHVSEIEASHQRWKRDAELQTYMTENIVYKEIISAL